LFKRARIIEQEFKSLPSRQFKVPTAKNYTSMSAQANTTPDGSTSDEPGHNQTEEGATGLSTPKATMSNQQAKSKEPEWATKMMDHIRKLESEVKALKLKDQQQQYRKEPNFHLESKVRLPQPRGRGCFFCSDISHFIRDCPQLRPISASQQGYNTFQPRGRGNYDPWRQQFPGPGHFQGHQGN
jgi:hypothetical protein